MKTFTILILLVLLAGCRGTPTKGEKEARRQVQAVAGSYRPNGRKPELPALTAQSSLSNFLAYALLNQPQVEAAYFDWLASVERITVERSLPDPQVDLPDGHSAGRHLAHAGLDDEFPGHGQTAGGRGCGERRKPGQVLRVSDRLASERLRGEARLLPALLPGGEAPRQPGEPQLAR